MNKWLEVGISLSIVVAILGASSERVQSWVFEQLNNIPSGYQNPNFKLNPNYFKQDEEDRESENSYETAQSFSQGGNPKGTKRKNGKSKKTRKK